MITPGRSSGTATLLPDGTVLVAGGTAGSEVLSSAELFDPASRAWAATASMLEDRVGHSATLLPDGTVLVAGGTSLVRPATILESAELYDPATGTWTATGDMIQGRTSHLATLLTDGRVLVVGRGDAINGAVSAELYDPASGTWTATADMSRARDGATATLLPDGRVLVAGGHDDDRLASAELYDPVTGTWTATGELTEAYVAHSATLLLDGTVLVAGGDAPSGPGAIGWPHAEVYDPVTGTWAAVAPMATARLHPTATLLTDGRVLVSGGQVSGGAGSELLPEAEIYDPVTQTWTAIGDMIAARSGHTATLLPDGRVLVVGGLSSDLQTSAELYDPDG